MYQCSLQYKEEGKESITVNSVQQFMTNIVYLVKLFFTQRHKTRVQLWYTASKIGNLSFFKKMVFNSTVKAVDNKSKWLSIISTGAYRVQCILYTVQCTMYSTNYDVWYT